MYYTLDIEVAKKGNFAERERFETSYDVYAENAQATLSRYEFTDREIVFSELILTDRSSEVDFITDGSIGGVGMIVSTRIKELLQNFNLGQHRFYPLVYLDQNNVRHKNRYHWLQILVKDVYKWIDYEKSAIFEIELWDWLDSNFSANKYLSLNNAQELEDYLETYDVINKKIRYDKVVFTKEFCSNPLDLFDLFRIDYYNFTISEKLRDALLDIKATGLEPFVETNKFCQ
jgi:hypothetical protein